MDDVQPTSIAYRPRTVCYQYRRNGECMTRGSWRTRRADADKARREEWRAAHLLLSVPVPDSLICLFRGKTAPLPSTPDLVTKGTRLHGLNTSSLVRLLLSGSWRTTTRTTAHSSLSKAFHLELSSRYRRIRLAVHKRQIEPTQLPLWSLDWRTCTCTARATPERPRRSTDSPKKVDVRTVKLSRAMTTAEVFTKLG